MSRNEYMPHLGCLFVEFVALLLNAVAVCCGEGPARVYKMCCCYLINAGVRDEHSGWYLSPTAGWWCCHMNMDDKDNPKGAQSIWRENQLHSTLPGLLSAHVPPLFCPHPTFLTPSHLPSWVTFIVGPSPDHCSVQGRSSLTSGSVWLWVLSTGCLPQPWSTPHCQNASFDDSGGGRPRIGLIMKIDGSRFRMNQKQSFPIQNIINLYNLFSKNTLRATSLDVVKRGLD